MPTFIAIGSLIAAMVFALKPPDQGPVAVLFPPWWTGSHALSAAASAGAFIRFGAFPFIVVIAPDGASYGSTLSQHGAWFVLTPIVAGVCKADREA